MAYDTAETIRAWLRDNPGFHFTDDLLEGCVARNPNHTRSQYRVSLYQLERSKNSIVESGGSSETRKWRYRQ